MSYNSRHGLGSHTIAAAITGEWLLQETSGTTAADISGNAYTQDLIGGSNISTRTVQGPNSWLPNGISLSGSGNYFKKAGPELTIEGTAHATISFWAKANTTSGIQIGMYEGTYSGSVTRFGLQQYGGKIYLVAENGAGSYPYTSYSNTSTWAHLTLVYDGTLISADRMKLFIDGVRQTAFTSGSSPSATLYTDLNAFCIGIFAKYFFGDASYAGVTISDDSLSAGDITEEVGGPELENTSLPTLTIDSTSFSGSVGSWSLPSPFASGSNGTPTYQWELRDADDDSVVASGSTSTISGSGSYSGDYYLWVRASNNGGYDAAEDSVSTTQTVSGGGGPDNLTANGVTAGAPSVGAPALGQVHILTASSVATGSPSVSGPSLGQVHSLAASSVATGAPSVGSPAIGQTHSLTASSVSTGDPSVGSPTLGQTHALSATAIATGSPSVGTPTLGQVHALTANGVATGTPTVGSPSLDSSSGVDDLTPNGVTTGAPTVGSPALGQVHALTASSVSAGSPSVGSPAIGQLHALVASAIASGAPSVGSPAIGQVHVLVASGVSAGNPSVGTPALNGPSFRPWFAQANVLVAA